MEDSYEDVYVSIPRGGPLYVSDMVGPLSTSSSVSDFRSCVEDELKDLRKELCLELTEEHHEISVDELKILSEEELVDMAYQASLKGANMTRDPSPSPEECSNGTTNDGKVTDASLKCSTKSGLDEDYVPSNDFPKKSKRATKNRKMNGEISKRRKRVTKKDATHKEDYMLKVEKIAIIKEKQEEDKAAARLHSFSGDSGPISCSTFPEKKEHMSSFNFTSYSTQVKSSSAREHILLHGSEILLCVEVYHINRQATWVKDVFYNDLRDAHAIDYSKPILDWLGESKENALEKWVCIVSGKLQQKQVKILGSGSRPKLPQLTSCPMQATRFCDLSFRLGAGYLYCHQGDCKHVMVIRDMRLIHPAENVQN